MCCFDQEWLQNHCRQWLSTFQYDDSVRYHTATTQPEFLEWHLDPVLKDSDHFKPYEEVKGTETAESDRPSLQSSIYRTINTQGATSVENG